MGAEDFKDFTFRAPTEDEVAQGGRHIDYAFNEEGGEAFGCRPEWSLYAFDNKITKGSIAATAGAYPFQMGFEGKQVPCAGVTIITTEPQYRRRGLVRELNTQLLHKAKADGQPVAALWASMGALYQRYGYGLASNFNRYAIDPRNIVFREPMDVGGYVRRLGADEAMPFIKDVYARTIEGRTLTLEREDYFWEVMYLKRDKDKRHFAVSFDDQDCPRGFAVYLQKDIQMPDGNPSTGLTVYDFVWQDVAAHRALWTYFQSHDLCHRVTCFYMPDDDPATQTLLEPRKLGRRVADGLWLRVVDAPALLAGRGYSLPGTVSIRVEGDELCPWNNGTWTVSADGNGAGATVRESAPGPETLTLSINTLATLASGHTAASQLGAMGKIKGEAKSLRAADALFSTTWRPWCPHEF